MYCFNCKKQIDDTDLFCPFCGASQGLPEAEKEKEESYTPEYFKSQKQNPNPENPSYFFPLDEIQKSESAAAPTPGSSQPTDNPQVHPSDQPTPPEPLEITFGKSKRKNIPPSVWIGSACAAVLLVFGIGFLLWNSSRKREEMVKEQNITKSTTLTQMTQYPETEWTNLPETNRPQETGTFTVDAPNPPSVTNASTALPAASTAATSTIVQTLPTLLPTPFPLSTPTPKPVEESTNMQQMQSADVFEKWLYYAFDGIFREKVDGGQIEKISDASVNEFLRYENKIYYVDEEKLYSMNLDGTQNKLLKEDVYSCLTITDDEVYYLGDFEEKNTYPFSLRKMNLNGSDDKLVKKDLTYDLCFLNGWVYGCTYDEVFRFRPSSGQTETLASGYEAVQYLSVSQEYVYFTEFTGDISTTGIKRIRLSDRAVDSLWEGSSYKTKEHEEWVYFEEMAEFGFPQNDSIYVVTKVYLNRIHSRTKKVERIVEKACDPISGFSFVGDQLYYRTKEGLFRVDIDGGVPQAVVERPAVPQATTSGSGAR